MKVNEECVRGPSSQPFKVKFETKYPQKGAGSAELFELTVSLRTSATKFRAAMEESA
jgi:hypothetical protein